MSSYFPSFNYMGINSLKNKNLIVVHFENGDSGENETFLSMESVYTETAYGTHRNDYGAKYNDVARPRISVMKADGKEFSVLEVRDFLKWTTGVRKISYLDLVENYIDGNGEEQQAVRFSYLGRVINVLQHKIDARTIGFTIEFESINPYAWSPQKYIHCEHNQAFEVDSSGVLIKSNRTLLNIDESGVVYNGTNTLSLRDDGTVFIDNAEVIEIDNGSDDLYTYVYLDTTFKNNNCDYLSIKNKTLGEETIIKNMSKDEIITLSSGQFIVSKNMYNKVFGDDFNFVWPRLAPGINEFIIDGSGEWTIDFTYRYPIKIGDCAIDIDVSDGGINCGECPDIDTPESSLVAWDNIVGTPTTIKGYGITDAYTKPEIEEKIHDVNIDEDELDNMLEKVFSS